MADSHAMWFRVLLLIGLLCGATPAAAQTWTACYDAASDSLTPDGHRAVREAAAGHLNDPEAFSQTGWPGVLMAVALPAEEQARDWRAVYRVMIELRRLGVGPHKMQGPDIRYDASVAGRDGCVEISLVTTPARTWHYSAVYFLENSAALTEAGRFALEGVAVDYVPGRTRLIVNGYDDTAGTVETSLALSEQRTVVVAEGLVRLGVRWVDIEQHSWGETNLARPTADGVAEPLNRRVTIDLRTLPAPAC